MKESKKIIECQHAVLELKSPVRPLGVHIAPLYLDNEDAWLIICALRAAALTGRLDLRPRYKSLSNAIEKLYLEVSSG